MCLWARLVTSRWLERKIPAMFRALMAKTDQQVTTILGQEVVKIDQHAAQIKEVAAQVREEVAAAQDAPMLDQQLCTVTGHCELTVSVADMEKPCLLGPDSLFRKAACDDLRRMQRQLRGEAVPLILEAAAKQVESPVTSSDVEDERLELHC